MAGENCWVQLRGVLYLVLGTIEFLGGRAKLLGTIERCEPNCGIPLSFQVLATSRLLQSLLETALDCPTITKSTSSLNANARCIALHAGRDASRLAETFPRFAMFWYWGCQACEHIEHLWWELPWMRQSQSRDPPSPTNTVYTLEDTCQVKPSNHGVWALYIPSALLTPHCWEV